MAGSKQIAKKLFGSAERSVFFGSKTKQHDEYQQKHMYYARDTPGPGSYAKTNKFTEERKRKVKPTNPNWSREVRKVGEPIPSAATPGPGRYNPDGSAKKVRAQRWAMARRRVDIMKRASGLEEFTIKGIV